VATAPIDRVLRHLRQAVLRQDGRTDGQLLAFFIDKMEEAAFEALVHRHGPMVFGVCRRVAGNHHDAEDAFQATFLVLARKAASIRPRERVANWLHGVTLRTALKAKTMTAKRRVRERQVTEMPESEAAPQDEWCELQPLLDQELNSLPENYRLAIVLCDLEGKTIKAATQQLGWAQGTLATRLARGRKLLARRLTNRGVVLSVGALAAVVSQKVASAGVPTSLVSSTVKAATVMAAGPAAVAGMVPAKVTVLVEGVMRAMSLSKFKTALVLLIVSCVLGWGRRVAWQTQAKAEPGVPQALVPTTPDLGGTWQGDGWGAVVLFRTDRGDFAGTYTDTYGKDVGRIAVRWTSASRQYEGTWSEGKFRFGRIALQSAKDGEAISGAYTTDPKCAIWPGMPDLAGLRWSRVKPASGDAVRNDSSLGEDKDTDLKKTLLKLDELWWKGDVETLRKLAADDLITVSGVGRYDKASLLEASRNRHATDWTKRNVEVSRISKDVAIVTYVYDCKVVLSDGTLFQNCRDRRSSMTWVNRKGGWVVVFSQETILPGGE
jgi:RNA polymerase sigma factor (sigma-70 family)